jgi:hypothetical protein
VFGRATFAARHRLPAVYPFRLFIAAGGLMAYETDISEISRLVAFYIDRILRGAKPADLPKAGALRTGPGCEPQRRAYGDRGERNGGALDGGRPTALAFFAFGVNCSTLCVWFKRTLVEWER